MNRGMKAKSKIPSLSALARLANPLDDPETLLQRLTLETVESRHLEWKLTTPFGPGVTTKIKYRMVKALISFANTDGGFIVFGVDPQGKWLGFSEADVLGTDPAMIAELVSGCSTPELTGLNYGLLRVSSRIFPLLHTPPSSLMPHVTTKEIAEKLPSGKQETYLQRHAVYCRYSAKSDLATATQYARIIAQRTDMLKAEMLRRVKEINVPLLIPSAGGVPSPKTIIRVSRATKDKTVPAIRITRDPLEAAGVIVHEELSEGIFEEITNVIEVNRRLASDDRSFVFGEDIYYRIYAERYHVQPEEETFEMLASTAMLRLYAPSFFWMLRMSAVGVARVIRAVLVNPRSMNVRLVCRLVVLLGARPTDWLMKMLNKRWKSHPQPPDHYFSFKKMVASMPEIDPRLVAIQQSANSSIEIPGEPVAVAVRDLLSNPQQAANLLSKVCMIVFKGDHSRRQVCRQLDVLAFGYELLKLGERVADELSHNDEA